MSTNEAAAAVLGIMFVITNFQGVGKDVDMDKNKFDLGRVIVKTVNWSAWAALGTLMLLFTNAVVGSVATGILIGAGVGLYLVGCMVIAMTAWINDNPFKRSSKSTDQNAQSNADKQVIVKHVNA